MFENFASLSDQCVWRRRRTRVTVVSGLTVAVLGGVGAAHAEGQGSTLEEVVITANRTGAQRLQDVPMAISALAPDDLSTKGLVAMEDFLRNVPGVVLNSASTGVNRITMRGLVTSELNFTQLQDRSLVALYLDEIPIGLNMSNPDLRAVELERVEVIRGPQGTLYGAGSMAGTIRYISKKPDPTEFSGVTEAQTSATQRGGENWNLRGALNLPIVPSKLALRLGAYRETQDGYVDNIGTRQKDANSLVNTQANAALRWLPTDALTVDASVTYQKLESDGTNGIYRQLDDKYSSQRPVGFDDDLKIFNLTLGYDTSLFDVISSTSYVDREFDQRSSYDFLVEASLGATLASPSSSLSALENFTQEIRVVSKPGRWRWQVGAFYGDDKRRYLQNTFAEGLDQLVGISATDLFAPHPDEIYYADIRVEDKQWALFGETTYELTDQLAVTAGLRYFNFEGPATYFQGGIAGTDALGLPVALAATETADGVNPKLVVTYKPNDDFMLFAEAARGFRYGGVNYPVPDSFCAASLAEDGLTSAPLTFGPDHVWSFSLGEKSTIADGRMTLNATAFLVNWTEAQTLHPLACGYPFTENGGKIRSTGLELESRFSVTPELVIALNAAYTNAESNGGIATIQARDGDTVPFFPQWLASVSADYTWAIASGEITFSTDYSYRDEMGTEFNPNGATYREIPSSGVVNASLNYATGAWQMGIFGTNLSDSEQISSIAPRSRPTDPGDLIYLGRPRTIGLRLQRKF